MVASKPRPHGAGPRAPAVYSTPGPSHVRTTPSVNSHTVRRGVAVAVTVTSPSLARSVTATQAARSTASHISTPTTCTPLTGGEVRAPGR